MAAGPPVVLFPSLAGSVLECEESPFPKYKGTRVWMGLSTLMAKRSSRCFTASITVAASPVCSVCSVWLALLLTVTVVLVVTGLIIVRSSFGTRQRPCTL